MVMVTHPMAPDAIRGTPEAFHSTPPPEVEAQEVIHVATEVEAREVIHVAMVVEAMTPTEAKVEEEGIQIQDHPQQGLEEEVQGDPNPQMVGALEVRQDHLEDPEVQVLILQVMITWYHPNMEHTVPTLRVSLKLRGGCSRIT